MFCSPQIVHSYKHLETLGNAIWKEISAEKNIFVVVVK